MQALLANALVDFANCCVPYGSMQSQCGSREQVERMLLFGTDQVAGRCLEPRSKVSADFVAREALVTR